ncbi:MAG: hypothetical protein WBE65_11910 [Steroidobacteraceae bacterium]
MTALLGLFLIGLAGAAAPVRADPARTTPPPKASSLAPHHTGRRVYGSPIEPQILHSRKRKPVTHRTAPAASGSHTAAPQP